jgi:hypothetical protein
MGFLSALFLVVLAITGLALNHTERLGLDQIQIRNGWILAQYGMAGGSDIQAYRIHESDTLAYLDGQLFYNGTPLTGGEAPHGIIEGDRITVVATADQLIYLSPDGELIEILRASQLPYAKLVAVGYTPNKKTVLITNVGQWKPDRDWLDFKAYESSYTVEPLVQIELSESETDALLKAFQGGGVSLYRVLLDLHSGRLFGWGGRTIMDLTAGAILLLVTSGIGGWLRKSRRKTTTV